MMNYLTQTKIKYFIVLLFTSITLSINAQELQSCRTSIPESFNAEELPYFGNNEMLLDLLKQYGYNFDGSRNGRNNTGDGFTCAQWRVPIKIWIARRDDGTDGITEDEALTRIEELNDQFEAAGTGIQFYALCEIGLIDDDDLHTIQPAFVAADVPDNLRIPEVINLYLAREIIGYWGFAQIPDDTPNLMAFMDRTADQSVFAHEIGHVLGLFHPHYPGRIGSGNNGQVGNC